MIQIDLSTLSPAGLKTFSLTAKALAGRFSGEGKVFEQPIALFEELEAAVELEVDRRMKQREPSPIQLAWTPDPDADPAVTATALRHGLTHALSVRESDNTGSKLARIWNQVLIGLDDFKRERSDDIEARRRSEAGLQPGDDDWTPE